MRHYASLLSTGEKIIKVPTKHELMKKLKVRLEKAMDCQKRIQKCLCTGEDTDVLEVARIIRSAANDVKNFNIVSQSTNFPHFTVDPASELYCICQKPDDQESQMIECECGQWFHPKCIGIEHEFDLARLDFKCERCVVSSLGDLYVKPTGEHGAVNVLKTLEVLFPRNVLLKKNIISKVKRPSIQRVRALVKRAQKHRHYNARTYSG